MNLCPAPAHLDLPPPPPAYASALPPHTQAFTKLSGSLGISLQQLLSDQELMTRLVSGPSLDGQ